MKNTVILLLAIALSGCGTPAFTIKQLDNSFSESKNITHASEGNRISSKSIAGGSYIDKDGVYLNPFIEKTTQGETITLGFSIENHTNYNTSFGGVNQLGTITKVAFKFEDDTLMTFDISNNETNQGDTINYNSVSKYAGYDVLERGTFSITKEQFKRLTTTPLSCKISGTKQSVVYNNDDISAAFTANLAIFYAKHIEAK